MPIPDLVKISSRRVWGILPSIKWTFSTPLSKASNAEVIFGIIPPEIVPFAMRFLASSPVTDSMSDDWSAGSLRRPGTSER